MNQNQPLLHKTAKYLIQKMVCSEYLEWPPKTPFSIYQPYRPEHPFIVSEESNDR